MLSKNFKRVKEHTLKFKNKAADEDFDIKTLQEIQPWILVQNEACLELTNYVTSAAIQVKLISSTNKSLIWQLIIFDDQKDINYNYFYEMTDTISCRKFYKNETRHSYAVKDADKDEHKIVQFNKEFVTCSVL